MSTDKMSIDKKSLKSKIWQHFKVLSPVFFAGAACGPALYITHKSDAEKLEEKMCLDIDSAMSSAYYDFPHQNKESMFVTDVVNAELRYDASNVDAERQGPYGDLKCDWDRNYNLELPTIDHRDPEYCAKKAALAGGRMESFAAHLETSEEMAPFGGMIDIKYVVPKSEAEGSCAKGRTSAFPILPPTSLDY